MQTLEFCSWNEFLKAIEALYGPSFYHHGDYTN